MKMVFKKIGTNIDIFRLYKSGERSLAIDNLYT